MSRPPLSWAYGVTSVPARRADLLPRTLTSLKAGGFTTPRLFVDGARRGADEYQTLFPDLEVTTRTPAVRTFGNFVLSLWELYLRAPTADRYALFQDDFVCVSNLRAYLDRAKFPEGGYLNLYTFRENDPYFAEARRVEVRVPRSEGGWCEGFRPGFFETTQKGRGAVALVFDLPAVQALLASAHFVGRPTDPTRGHRAVDGGIVTALNKAGFREYCHWPSLVQHTGDVSSMGNAPHSKADSFPGEEADALQYLPVAT